MEMNKIYYSLYSGKCTLNMGLTIPLVYIVQRLLLSLWLHSKAVDCGGMTGKTWHGAISLAGSWRAAGVSGNP